MKAVKQAAPSAPPADYHVSESLTIHGRHVERGTELSIRGLRGRARFMRHVRRDNGAEWIDVIQPDIAGWRSFRLDRVKTVHTRRKTFAA